MKLLDLFSGIGGFSLGAEYNNIETIGFVEKDAFCQKVLRKHWPNTPIIGNIRDVTKDTFKSVDIVSGGFPCQPFSVAGKRRGTDDDRYLWDETIRVVSLYKPRWFVGENVEGIVNIQNGMVLRQVQDDLEKEGFEVQCGIIPASGIGAWHQRKRVWILGYSQHNGSSTTKEQRGNTQTSTGSQKRENSPLQSERTSRPTDNGNVSHTNNDGLKRGQSETCNKDASGKNNTSFRGKSSNNTGRSDDDGGDKKKSRIDERVSESHDGDQEKSTSTKGFCDLSEKSNKRSTIDKTSSDQENNDRTLVQKRQVFQLSNSRGLENDQASFERNKIRQGDDNTVSHRVDTNDVSNTYSSLRRGRATVSQGRENKIWGFHSKEEKQNQSDLWSETVRCDVVFREKQNVSNSSSEGQLLRKSGNLGEKSEETQSARENDTQGIENTSARGKQEDIQYSHDQRWQEHQLSQEPEEQNFNSGELNAGEKPTQSWWEIESSICTIPDGVSYELDKDRVNQIKSLGNSIVPQIAYQIFYAIISAEGKNRG